MKITIEPTWKQHLAWQILLDTVTLEFLFGGGAGGGKSWLGCEWLIYLCLNYPETRYFIARKTLKILKRTTLRTFFKVARHHGLRKDIDYIYSEQSAVITFPETGSTIDLLEVKYNPSDPDYEDLGSSEYTAGWIEEAGEVDFGAYDTLKSRVGRQYNDKYGILGKLFITCNPKKNWLYRMFYLPWKKKLLPIQMKFLQSLVDDNPRNEKGYRDNLVNIKDPVKKQRLLYGKWEYDDEAGVLIKYDNILDLFTNTLEPDEEKYMSIDVARFGPDKTVIYLWRGLENYKQIIFRKKSIEQQKEKVREIAADEKVPFSHIVADEDGVGGGLVDGLEGIRGFVANSNPLVVQDKENTQQKVDSVQRIDVPNFKNLKAQCSYELAKVINAHLMAIKVNIVTEEEDITPERFKEDIIQELEQIKEKDPDSDEKKLQVTPKEETKENIGRSPDYADALVMRMLFEIRKQISEAEKRQSAAESLRNRLKSQVNTAR